VRLLLGSGSLPDTQCWLNTIMRYTLQYKDTLTFLQTTILLPVYSTPYLLRRKITSFVRRLLTLETLTTAAFLSPGLPHNTGLNPFIASKFLVPLVGVTHLTPVAPFATAPSSVI
jgi:hypothetical protein